MAPPLHLDKVLLTSAADTGHLRPGRPRECRYTAGGELAIKPPVPRFRLGVQKPIGRVAVLSAARRATPKMGKEKFRN